MNKFFLMFFPMLEAYALSLVRTPLPITKKVFIMFSLMLVTYALGHSSLIFLSG